MKLIRIIIFLSFPILIITCTEKSELGKNYFSLHTKIDSIRIENQIPAIAYGVINSEGVLIQKVIGYRNIETKEKAELNDLFNIASNTKSFIAMIAGKLVENGLLKWDSKFFELFPELQKTSRREYHDITLQDLLSHRARLIRFKNESEVYPMADYEKSIDPNISIEEKKYFFIKNVLKYDPLPILEHEDDRYSNAGYIAALLMIEKATGKNWDELINQFMDDTGIYCQNGWPDKYDKQQPKGHIDPKDWLIDLDQEVIALPEILRQYHFFNQYFLLNAPISISLTDFLEFLRLHIEGFSFWKKLVYVRESAAIAVYRVKGKGGI